jgi:hypothetical protein
VSERELTLDDLRLTPEVIEARRAVEAQTGVRLNSSAKIEKRRQQFVKVPWTWVERLEGASGNTVLVALHLLHLAWKNKGESFKLPNGMLKQDGIGRHSKWRAIADLQRRGLVVAERRARKSPLIRLVQI